MLPTAAPAMPPAVPGPPAAPTGAELRQLTSTLPSVACPAMPPRPSGTAVTAPRLSHSSIRVVPAPPTMPPVFPFPAVLPLWRTSPSLMQRIISIFETPPAMPPTLFCELLPFAGSSTSPRFTQSRMREPLLCWVPPRMPPALRSALETFPRFSQYWMTMAFSLFSPTMPPTL